MLDTVIVVVIALIIGATIGIALSGCVMVSRSIENDELVAHYRKEINTLSQELARKNKFLFRYRQRTLAIVQEFLKDDPATCTMIVAALRGIKEDKAEHAE